MAPTVECAKANSPSTAGHQRRPISSAASARLDLREAPRQGRHDGPVCRLNFRAVAAGDQGVDLQQSRSDLWLHQSRRDSCCSPEEQRLPAAPFAALAGAAGSDRHLDRRWSASRQCELAPHCLDETAAGHQARPLRIHPAGAAAGRGTSRREEVVCFSAAISFAAFFPAPDVFLRLAAAARRRPGAASRACAGETPPDRRRPR